MRAWRIAILALSVGAVSAAAWRYLDARTNLERAVSDSTNAQKALAARQIPTTTRAATLSPSEIEAINGAISRLNFPWQLLLRALEEFKPKTIALLDLTPDADRRTLGITAEAKSAEDMLEFVAGLKRQQPFEEAVLVKHEIIEQDPNRPYRFRVEARWAGSP